MAQLPLGDSLLVSAGIGLPFFLAAGILLCFGVGGRAMLITYRCFSCCWVMFIRSQGLFQPPTLCRARRCRSSWQGAQPGERTQTPQRDIPHHRTSSSKHELGGRGGWGRDRCSGTAGHHLVGGEQLHCASLAFCILLLSLPLLSY